MKRVSLSDAAVADLDVIDDYEAKDDGIRVARVLHGARNLIAEMERDAGDD